MENNITMEDFSAIYNRSSKAVDKIVITYDNIILMKEIGLVEYLLDNFDYYNKYLKLDIFKKYKKCAIIRILVDRKEKDFISLFARDKNSEIKMRKELKDRLDKTLNNKVSNFATGLLKLIMTRNIDKVVILIDKSDIEGIRLLGNLYNQYTDLIYIVDKTEENMKKYFTDDSYGIIFTDETDILNLKKVKKKLKGKTVCIPFTGYNFRKQKSKIDDSEFIISKLAFEFESIKYFFNIGFIDAYKITKEMLEKVSE